MFEQELEARRWPAALDTESLILVQARGLRGGRAIGRRAPETEILPVYILHRTGGDGSGGRGLHNRGPLTESERDVALGPPWRTYMDKRSEGDTYPTPDEATDGEKPLQAEMRTEAAGLFPPDIDPAVEIGGSPEDHQVLREEFEVNRPGNP